MRLFTSRPTERAGTGAHHRRVPLQLVRIPLLIAMLGLVLPAPSVSLAAERTRTIDRRARVRQHVTDMKRKMTMQAQRESAASRQQLQQLSIGTMAAAASVVATPGGTPDYFGSPNWAFSPELRKFVDGLPGLGAANANNLGQYIPVAVPDTTKYPGSDYYEIGLVQYEEQLHSDLPPTTLRGYVQLNDPANPVTKDANGKIVGWPKPHYLGPFIQATKDRPVRVKFTNLLPTGAEGDLFIPVDTTMMGAGMGPKGMDPSPGKPMNYTQNRGTLHLHGGLTPWISDGTPHQWITPAGENTDYPKGVSVQNVPDMPDPGDGSQTFFYTNQQSARLMFYHDHSYGITRLNVYAGEAAGYAITDNVEKQLVADGKIPDADSTLPLIIQDKTFVDADTVRLTDPTWNWGTGAKDASGVVAPKTGDLWYPHVYSPAQNPADPSGMNAFGRWHYGPWFWPPTTNLTFPPVPNPYYDPVNAPWEPEYMPATPNPSAPGEAFMDTAMVNGTAFPTVTLDPKSYRLRILNASDDRFWNLQMYEADATTTSADGRTDTEVKMVPAGPTPGFPETWPTDGRDGGVPDPATVGPDWVQIANEGGFLPAPAVIAQQPITWNMDPTNFNFGNVKLHSLLVAPAERADVVVDFSKYAGKTLILYNDAPAAFPARDPRLDYYTNDPDRSDTGGHTGTKVGYGPNTRTIMQIKIKATTPAPAFDLAALEAAFAKTDSKAGVFESSQNPIIVPDARYNSAYNKSFVADPYARIFDFKKTFRTVADTTVTVNFENKALQDEMGEAFDADYGRMMGKLGVELPGTNAGNQNFVLYGYIDPSTENVKMEMQPMAPVQGDGTQIWKITHNGVDTHPIHFHLFDVQLLNRVGWDNAVIPPDDNELGWKDTVRVNPLEDTIVALRAVKPKAPFGVPNSVRPLDPTMPLGSTMGFNSIDPKTGQALATPTVNKLVNFGWEYVWHCHILSHEEMDMMRPLTADGASRIATAPVLSGNRNVNTVNLTWTDATPGADFGTWGDPKAEIGFRVERAPVSTGGSVGAFTIAGTTLANVTTLADTVPSATATYVYRVVAFNAAGEAVSNALYIASTPPNAPSNLTATAPAASVNPPSIVLRWTNPTTGAGPSSLTLVRSTSSNFSTSVATITVAAGTTSYTDRPLSANQRYYYRLRAVNPAGTSAWSNSATAIAPNQLLAAVSNLRVTSRARTGVGVAWTNPTVTAPRGGFYAQYSGTSSTGPWTTKANLSASSTAYTYWSLTPGKRYWFRIVAFGSGQQAPSAVVSTTTLP